MLRRILITVAVTLIVVFVGAEWVAPIALSFWSASKFPPVAKVVPAELRDQAVSSVAGKKLSYFGYDFEVPCGAISMRPRPNSTRLTNPTKPWWTFIFVRECG